ncbi:MAG: hypothetical protein ABW034_19690 [Steroidobacteraceae bacterium]
MACCFIGALIISQLIAIWHDRRRIALYATVVLVASGVFGWQINSHLHHIQQFAAAAQAYVLGRDPVAVASVSPDLYCRVRSTTPGGGLSLDSAHI